MKRILFIIFILAKLNYLYASEYLVNPFNAKNGLDEDCINQVVEGNDGFIWMFNNSNLIRFDGENFKSISLLNNYRVDGIYKNPFNNNIYAIDEIKNLYLIEKGKVLIINKLDKQNEYRLFSRRIIILSSDLPRIKNLDFNNDATFIFINNKEYYINNYYFKNGIAKKIEIPFEPLVSKILTFGDTLVYVNYNNKFFYAVHKGKILFKSRVDINDKELWQIFTYENIGFVYNLNKFCFVFFKQKLFRFELNQSGLGLHKMLEFKYPIRPSDLIFLNRTSEYYLSTFNGLLQIKPSDFNLSNLSSKLYPSSISFILKVGKDSLLCNSGMLLVNNKIRGNYSKYLSDLISSMVYYKNNCLALFDNKLLSFNLTTRKLIKLANIRTGYKNNIYHFENNDLWCSIDNKLYQVKMNNKTYNINIKLKLKNNCLINNVFEHKGNIYVLTTSGLVRYDPLTNNSVYFGDNINFRSIYFDLYENIWLGSYGGGYFILKKDKGLVKMPLDEKIALSHTHCFVPDSLGNIWISTNNGIIKLNAKQVYNFLNNTDTTIHYDRFDYKDGLLVNEFNSQGTPNYQILTDGTVCFGSISGIISFNPYKIKKTVNNFPIVIDYLKVNGVTYCDSNIFLLPNNSSNILIQLATPLFDYRSNFKYEYKIIEKNQDWQTLDKDGRLIINYLTFGSYHLLIRKVGSNGNYILNEKVIIIQPLFYQNYWFVSLVVFFILMLFWVFVYLRNKRLINKQKYLEKLVQIKTQEINNSLIALSKSNESLAQTDLLKERLIRVLAHDIRSPLKSTHTVANYLLKQLLSIRKQANKLNLAEMEEMMLIITESVKSLYDYSNDFLVWYNLQKDLTKISLSNVNVKEIVTSVLNVYKTTIDLKGNHIINTIYQDVIVQSDPNLLLIIVRNLVDNANKYTELNAIYIEVIREEKEIFISVSNQGNKMTVDEIVTIKQKIANRNTNINPQEGQKMGLNLVAFFCTILDYKLDFKSINGLHKFTVIIPIYR
jgi:signal transduction histidine kinase